MKTMIFIIVFSCHYGFSQSHSISPVEFEEISVPSFIPNEIKFRIEGCVNYNSDGSCAAYGAIKNEGSAGDKTDRYGESSSPVASTPSCSLAQVSAKNACNGTTWAATNGIMVQQLSSMVTAASTVTNTAQACKASKNLNSLMASANGTIATMCATAANKCRSACKAEDDEDGVSQCDELSKNSKPTAAQGLMNAGNAAMSKEVCDAVSAHTESCHGDKAYDNENCMQFCLKPGRQLHSKCQMAQNNCASVNYASQNIQYCTCINNPFAPNCSAIASKETSAPNASSSNVDFDDLKAGSNSDFDGAIDKETPTQVSTHQGGGSSTRGLTGSSFVINEGQNGGAGDEPLSKDILNGTNGNGNNSASYGGGYNSSFNSNANKSSNGNTNEGFDLKSFLPGGKKAVNRNPSSAGYTDPTITKANGLTNWQKITRKMNEKRPELMP